jgi:hypothetical protein
LAFGITMSAPGSTWASTASGDVGFEDTPVRVIAELSRQLSRSTSESTIPLPTMPWDFVVGVVGGTEPPVQGRVVGGGMM